jgi:hypothetical protein
MTVTELRALAVQVRACAAPVKRVETRLQAQWMTLTDPFGHVWHEGEEYYSMPLPKRRGR